MSPSAFLDRRSPPSERASWRFWAREMDCGPRYGPISPPNSRL